MIYGAILAGGMGQRMTQAVVPKQFLEIEGEAIIWIAIKKMLSVERFDKLIIAMHPEWSDYLEKMLAIKLGKKYSRIVVIDGGSTRLQSIENILSTIEKDGFHDDDVVILHDAVRPFVTKKLLENSIDATLKHQAVGVAAPVVDTMFWVENGTIQSMPDRDHLFHGQTPEGFHVQTLKKALEQLTPQERDTITGTVQICMVKGIPIHIISGDNENFKITSDSDFAMAQAYIKAGLDETR
ncbi:ribitol-5-phosphate cytidylyltransferase [Fibrobacterales bacterium]|nr:ribitol-5-phosphate cytidylyltransferase [Fibrobacterales bacterium]